MLHYTWTSTLGKEKGSHACRHIYIQPRSLSETGICIQKLLCRWTSIFGRDRVECIDVCISYHPAPARYMSVFKNTETRHISCGTRMSTYAEPDVDSVDWSKGSVKEWSFHGNAFASNQKVRLSEYFREKLPSLCPYLEDCKSKDTPRVNQSLPTK